MEKQDIAKNESNQPEQKLQDEQAWYKKGEFFLSKRNYTEAISAFGRAIEFDPFNLDAYMYRAYCLHNLRHYIAAIADYDKVVELKPDHVTAYNNRGNSLADLGRYEEAIDSYNKAIELKPDYAFAYNNRGNSLCKLGRYKEAIDDYDKALKIDSLNSTIRKNKAEAQLQLGKYLEVAATPQDATEESPAFIAEQVRSVVDEPEEIKQTIVRFGVAIFEAARRVRLHCVAPAQEAAHYTRLSIANIIVMKDKDDSRLRYGNVVFMNDPEEGKILGDMLRWLDATKAKNIMQCFDAAALREENNVYLGSFVPANHADELVMWRTYGKEGGEEATGCCLLIQPGFFSNDGERDLQWGMSITAKDAVDMGNECLYNVVYFDKKKNKISSDKAEALKADIEKLVTALHDLCAQKTQRQADETDKDYENRLRNRAINAIIYRALSEIRYLFKSADYSFENELRVIQYASGNDKRVKIDTRNGPPHPLYLESEKPILPHLGTLYLGPKVANADQWMYLEVKMRKDGLKMELLRSQCKFK